MRTTLVALFVRLGVAEVRGNNVAACCFVEENKPTGLGGDVFTERLDETGRHISFAGKELLALVLLGLRCAFSNRFMSSRRADSRA